MAFVFDATISGTSSNSYITVEQADDYFEARMDKDEWDCLTTAEKQAILAQSTRRIDSEYFKGQKTNQLQALEWPRNFIYDKDGFPLDENTIPRGLIWATCEMALYTLNEKNREVTNTMREDMSKVKIGPLEYELRSTRTGNKLPELVKFYLKGIGSAWISNRFPTQVMR